MTKLAYAKRRSGEAAPTVTGTWAAVSEPIIVEGGMNLVTVLRAIGTWRYRLVQ